MVSGIADDDEPEALTVDKVPAEKLKALPHAQGLAVSLNYEHKSHTDKYNHTAKGEVGPGKAKPHLRNVSEQVAKRPAANPDVMAKATRYRSDPSGRSRLQSGGSGPSAVQQDGSCVAAANLQDEVIDSTSNVLEVRMEGLPRTTLKPLQFQFLRHESVSRSSSWDLSRWKLL